MFKHFFKITIRNLYRHKLYTIINTIGLALGLTISFIIFSWVNFELNYDKFNENYDRIYRLTEEDEGGGSASISPAVKTVILDKIPEIEYSVRLFYIGQLGGRSKVTVDDQVYTDDKIIFTDAEFFNIFSFPLLYGNPDLIFSKSNAVVLTETTARKYYGTTDAVGKTFLIHDSVPFEVTGVIATPPVQSHFHFDMLINMKSHPWGDYLERCSIGSGWMFHTYFKIYPGSSPELVEKKCQEICNQLTVEIHPDYKVQLHLQSLTDIHLKSALEGELEANNDIRYIYLFSSIALLVIIIAGINYINLSTAFSFSRSKETGIKKVMGARRLLLIVQYLSEAILISIFALFVSLLLIELAHPLLTSLTGYEFGSIFNNTQLLILLFSIAFVTGFISGIIPSLVLSAIPVKRIIRSGTFISDKRSGLRKILVIFQFCISLILLMGTMIIYSQLKYMQDIKLGYNKSHVMVLYTGYAGIKYENLKNGLLSDSRVINVSGISSLPTNIETNEYIDTSDKNKYWIYYTSVDKNFFKTMDINVISGKERIDNLTPEQYQNKYVLNQTLIKEIGWNTDEALSQRISIRHGNMEPGPVIGVIEDFHFQSLHYPMHPLVLEFRPGSNNYLLVRIQGDNIPETIKRIKSIWQQYSGSIPFEYSFLDQEYDNLYNAEIKTGKLFIIFAVFSSLIAMLGLFGLASFTAIKRTKEIGIRKVFGAGIINILRLLSGEFAKLVLIAFIISIPLGWYFMRQWLQEFAYKVNMNPLIIIFSGLVIMLLTLLTVGYHSIKAARTDPVETLRYE